MEPRRGFLDMQVRSVCFIGAGFVGGPTATVLAAHNPEIRVTVTDLNSTRIRAWNSDILPISEPGLLDLVQRHRVRQSPTPTNYAETTQSHNLLFSTDVGASILESDITFLCVDTSQSCDDDGIDNPLDLTNLKIAVSKIGETAVKDFIIVEKSTVPCGTARLIKSILSKTLRPGISYEILSNPEFLAEGSAIQDLEVPHRILIGASDDTPGRHAAQLLSLLYESWVPKHKILKMDVWSSELSKLCTNALLAQRISSINSFSMVCEKMGADVRSIAEAVKTDERVGPHMLDPSVGFGGSCFQKDIAHLVYLARSLGLDHVAQYWVSVLAINQIQKHSFAMRISERLAGLPSIVTTIAIFGFAFKAGTNDARNSPAIDIVHHLLRKHYEVQIYDPAVSQSDILSALKGKTLSKQDLSQNLRICATPYEACESASAVVVLTEWKDFEFSPLRFVGNLSVHNKDEEQQQQGEAWRKRTCFDTRGDESSIDSGFSSSYFDISESACRLDWAQIARAMTEPRYLFDGRNIVDDTISRYGFRVERIGRKANLV